MKKQDKEYVKVPVVMDYDADTMHIAGVKKEEVRTITFGGVTRNVIFRDVPAEQQKDYMKLFNAEFDFDKPKRRRYAAGIQEFGFEDLSIDIADDNAVNPLQAVIDAEEESFLDELIEILENKHEHFGEIFWERYDGNLNRSDIARTLDLPRSSVKEWFKTITELAIEFYEEKNKLK